MRQKQKQFVVLGLGRFGTSVAQALTELGHEVLAVDNDADRVEDVAPLVTQCVQADATDEEVLRSFDPAGFDACIVAIGTNVRDSVMVALLCKEAGCPMVIAKAMDDLHGKLLGKIGVDRVIYPERDMGQRLARSLVSPTILDIMQVSDGLGVAEMIAPANWIGKTLAELNVRQRTGLSVIGVRSKSGFNSMPGADTRIMEGDVVVMMGKEEAISRVQS